MNKLRFFIANLLLLLPAILFAQMKVSGTVNDQSGMPIPGVNVKVIGTTQGTVTDFDGNYSIENVKKGSVLEFSYVGYKTQQLNATAGTLNVTMAEDAQALQEVVVIGYGTTTKKDATGSVATLSEKDFATGNTATPASLISGRVAGVSITTDGSPGGGSAIRIRGGSSLDASNDPLIVIDGLPISNSTTGGSRSVLSSINPNDIESFSVLKDASATAIYGSRASNGVIIITTKKGKNVFQANYEAKIGFESLTKKIDVFSGDEFRKVVADRISLGQSGISLSQLGTYNTDWQDEIFQNATTFDNSFSASGALYDKLPTRLSLAYTDMPGLIKTSHFSRGNIGLAVNPKFFKEHLKVNLSANASFEKNRFQPDGIVSAALRMDPTQPVYDATSPFGGYFEYHNNGEPLNAPRNPLANIYQLENRGNVQRQFGNLEIDYKLHFLPDLRLVVNLGIDHSYGKGSSTRPTNSINGYRTGNNQPFLGSESNYTSERTNKLLDSYFNYKKDFKQFVFELTGGYSYQSFMSESFNSGELKNPNSESDINTEPEIRLIGFFGRTNLSFFDKYLLTLSYRRDGTSRFSPDNRWGNFPAAAFAWKMSDEDFLKNSKVISDLKLRLGWGITGQQDISAAYAYLGRYVTGDAVSQYILGNNTYPVSIPQAIFNDLKWEETTTYNAGFDYGILNNKFRGTLDVYYKESRDLLSNVPIADGSNFSNFGFQNIGKFISKGLEFSIGTDLVKNEKLTWDVNYNFNLNQTKIDELALGLDINFGNAGAGTGSPVLIHSVGFAPSSFFVYKQLYDVNNNPIEGAYVDINNDGVVNEDDRYIYRKPSADVNMGLQSNLTLGKFDMSFAFRASLNNYLYNAVNGVRAQWNLLQEVQALGNIPTAVQDTNFTATDAVYLSDYYVENASYLKFDNFNLGYTFDKFENLKSIKLWAGVQNIYTLTKYSGLDPEVFGGIDGTIYPRPRSIVVGANVKF